MKIHTDVVSICLRYLRLIFICLVIIIVMMATKALAQGMHGEGHDKLHHWYKQLMRPDMPHSSCCNDQDCRPTQARQLPDGRWEALKDGVWVIIPNEKINREESYDSQAHICAPPKAWTAYPQDFVFCFVKPGAGT